VSKINFKQVPASGDEASLGYTRPTQFSRLPRFPRGGFSLARGSFIEYKQANLDLTIFDLTISLI
jgi:hypothetical protein